MNEDAAVSLLLSRLIYEVSHPIADAIATVYREHAERLAERLRPVFGAELAGDAVQHAFLRALETWPPIPANPEGWLFVTARNYAIDEQRAEAAAVETLDIA